jgi:hypothetical protein
VHTGMPLGLFGVGPAASAGCLLGMAPWLLLSRGLQLPVVVVRVDGENSCCCMAVVQILPASLRCAYDEHILHDIWWPVWPVS